MAEPQGREVLAEGSGCSRQRCLPYLSGHLSQGLCQASASAFCSSELGFPQATCPQPSRGPAHLPLNTNGLFWPQDLRMFIFTYIPQCAKKGWKTCSSSVPSLRTWFCLHHTNLPPQTLWKLFPQPPTHQPARPYGTVPQKPPHKG